MQNSIATSHVLFKTYIYSKIKISIICFFQVRIICKSLSYQIMYRNIGGSYFQCCFECLTISSTFKWQPLDLHIGFKCIVGWVRSVCTYWRKQCDNSVNVNTYRKMEPNILLSLRQSRKQFNATVIVQNVNMKYQILLC